MAVRTYEEELAGTGTRPRAHTPAEAPPAPPLRQRSQPGSFATNLVDSASLAHADLDFYENTSAFLFRPSQLPPRFLSDSL